MPTDSYGEVLVEWAERVVDDEVDAALNERLADMLVELACIRIALETDPPPEPVRRILREAVAGLSRQLNTVREG